MDKTLRQQGMQADAISIECIPLNKKMVFLLHDKNPQQVDIAFGNKAGDINSSTYQSINALSVNRVVEYMSEYFKG